MFFDFVIDINEFVLNMRKEVNNLYINDYYEGVLGLEYFLDSKI